ncbi:MAG TPA: hypothetical protein VLA31_08620 [Burkholderiaceae bacterium]|nr:hypothetical protein [Burkholderiaceae bacterium]
MTDLRTAAQQALEALHVVLKDDYRLPYEKIVAATDALNVALAEPEPCRYPDCVEQQINELKRKPVQEPVAWRFQSAVGGWAYGSRPPLGSKYPAYPLYTAPPQRKPLTDEEIDALAIDKDGLPNSHLEFARAIERAHGIGGKDE